MAVPSPSSDAPRRWLTGLLLAGSALLTTFLVRHLYGPDLVSGGGDFGATFLLLLYVNLFLLLVLAGVVARYLGRLWYDRRRHHAGYRLRTRMVTLFVALALFPAAMVALLSIGLLNQGMDSWFSDQVQQALSQGLEVAKSYYRENQRTVRHDAEDLARNPTLREAARSPGGSRLGEILEAERRIRRLDELAVIRPDGTRLAGAGELLFDPLPDLTPLVSGSTAVLMHANDQGNRVRTFVFLDQDLILFAGRWIDRQVMGQMEAIELTYKHYTALRSTPDLLKDLHAASLLLITLL
ncbi:MAG: hypothetical protein H7831_16840, partial [Magnetococcus sp. WYHC-3]